MIRYHFLLALGVALAAGAVSAAPPAGFADTLVAAVDDPTALAFTSDGRLLVTSQTGKLRVIEDGALLPQPALDLGPDDRDVLCSTNERGLLGVAVDPQFATNHFIYLYYTFKKHPTAADPCPIHVPDSPDNPVNRVSRFVLPASNIVSPASETILVDNIPSPRGNHNAGDLRFGKDGYLYISIGDGGCDFDPPHSCFGGNPAARDLFVLLGKILRITRDGGIPPDNPWTGADSARCNVDGHTDPAKKCQELFAWGLRNPFRLAFDPNNASTRFFINDVGEGTWEEIDQGQAGADYGWTVREGFCARGSTTDCGPQPAGMTNPIYAYQHGAAPNNCNSITGGAFVPNGLWPAAYDGAYIYSDYVCGRIFKLSQSGASYTSEIFSSQAGAVIAMTFGPPAGPQALYYTTYSNNGQVRKIAYTGGANRSPSASASASPTNGDAPLEVDFSATSSSDPDGDVLIYDWNFGDGTTQSGGAAAAHTYTATGTYTATLTVSDGRGGSDSAQVRIDVGNTPPAPAIDAPAADFRFRVHQPITLEGSATDAQDGALPGAQLSWRVLLHHDEHTHPFLPPTSGVSVTISAPMPEDLPAAATSYLEVFLTATDSHGLTSVITRELRPRKVDLTFETDPSGLTVAVNSNPIVGPRTLVSWENYELSVAASDQPDGLGQTWLFDSWSDGGAATHTITTPAAAATYTATFQPAAGTRYVRFMPLIKK
jgi:glucose/arabinose dehydrogenase/PKD repeat protein